MPRNTTVTVAKEQWTQLTDADVTAITFQNISQSHQIFLRTTNGATPPTTLEGALIYGTGQGERSVLLADLTPGVTGANRVWAWSAGGGEVAVSHA